MKFKEWLELNETGTSTGNIAGFPRIVMPLVRRNWPSDLSDENLGKKKKKKKKKAYRVPQLDESNLMEDDVQEYWVGRATNILHYQRGYDQTTIANLSIKDLVGDIQKLYIMQQLDMPADFSVERFAAMIKSQATRRASRQMRIS